MGDWTGHVRAFDAETGEERWARDLDTLTGGLLAFRLDTDEPTDATPGATPGGAAGAPAGRSDGHPAGEDIHRESCATCHGASGEGASGPSLAGVADRLTRDEHLDVVRDGRGAMPGWTDTLDPDEIEAVVDYQRDVLTDMP